MLDNSRVALLGACSDAPVSPTGATASPTTATTAGTPVAAVEPTAAEPVSTTLQAASVSRVVDGDTIDVLIDGAQHRVRLIHIEDGHAGNGDLSGHGARVGAPSD